MATFGEAAVSVETARRLCCDAGIVDVQEDEHGNPVAIGRKWRTFCGPLKRALLHRDRKCTFPGCTNDKFLECHHLKHRIDGGETTLDNGAALCSLHHRFVHEYGYRIELDENGRPRFFDPKGRLVAQVPAPPKTRDLGWPTIRRDNAKLAITSETNTPLWDGNRVD